ncbi:MAG: flippase-like domain-containing protein [Candidatus Heimdallarchaeota archaeon]|nr:flippase-like domain-containing protein [Candidatus Heimdallarchaeota archaeon]MBY8993972.1 flippase-like domain-containing protein [Candidatus Heimdallarchaeota archaeon]
MAEEIQEILEEKDEKRLIRWLKKYWKYILGFFVTAGSLGILIWFADPTAIIDGLVNSNYWLILASFGLTLILFTIKVLRWQSILRVQGCKVSFFESLELILIGTFGSAITPAKVGDILRAFYLSRRKEVKIGKSVFSVVFDRICDLAGIILIVGVTTPFILTSFDGVINWWIPAGISLGFVLFIVLAVLVFNKKITGPILTFIVKFISKVFRKKEARSKIQITTEEIVDDFFESQKNYKVRNYLWLGTLSIAFWVILGLQGCVLLFAFNVQNISPFVIIAVLCLAAIVAMSIPISISGIGIRDTIVMTLLGLILGIMNADAINLSLIQTFLNVLIPGLIGGLLAMRVGIRKRDRPELPVAA